MFKMSRKQSSIAQYKRNMWPIFKRKDDKQMESSEMIQMLKWSKTLKVTIMFYKIKNKLK